VVDIADQSNNIETDDEVFNSTSVSRLSDINSEDWAFQALQSLVERYGCITGYEDHLYRGDRALTRFEFVAGLNACLSRINELIAANNGNLITSNADIWYYAVGLAFPDIGKEGNLGGLVIGAEPYRSNNYPPVNDIPFHIEAFYKYKLNDYIAITPGLIWLTAPAQNNNNDDAIIGIVRTTFTF
jgi:hypothetical protein